MPTAILHIGLHKTGTTWFQNQFWPSVGNIAYINRFQVLALIVEPRALDFDVETTKRRLPDSGETSLVFCEEELSGNIHGGGWRGLVTESTARRLHAVLPDAQVVVFIRRQADMIASVYGQYLRMGGTYGPKQYLHPEGFNTFATPLFNYGHFDYHRLLNCYAGLFGRKRIHVFPFEAFLENRQQFITRFCRQFDLQVDVDALNFDTELPGYNQLTMTAARLFNLFTREKLAFKYYICHLPGSFNRTRRWLQRLNELTRSVRKLSTEELLGRAEVRAIERRFGESNRALAETFGLDLTRYGYPMSGEEHGGTVARQK